MKTRLGLMFLSVVWGALGCGGTKETPVAPGRSQPAAIAAEAEDRSPVAAPADLFAVGRIPRVGQVVDTAAKWAGLPVDWRTLLTKEVPGIDRVIVFDAPIEFAAMLDPASGMQPNVFLAFSVGVASVDETLGFFHQRGEAVQRSARRIRFDADLVCNALPALGVAPARLVCAMDDDSLEALGPYMARGLPNEQLGAGDLFARLSAEPFRARYGAQLTWLKTAGVPFVRREIAIDHPPFDEALRDTLYAAADEILDVAQDVDRMELSLALVPEVERIDTEFKVVFRGARSWTAQTAAAASARAVPAPETFWRLPADATSASFSTYSDAKRAEKLGRFISRLLDGWLDYMKLPEARRRPLIEAFEKAWSIEGTSIHAELPASPGRAVGADQSVVESVRLAARRALGHQILRVDNDAGRYGALLHAAAQAYADRRFRAELVKLIDESADVSLLPTVRERAPQAGKGLPRGSVVYEVQVPAKVVDEDAARAKPITGVLVLVPDGTGTVVGISADEAELAQHLVQFIEKKNQRTLESIPELAELKAAKVLTGGYLTVLGMLDELEDPIEKASKGFDKPRETTKIAASMPHGGRVPIVWTVAASADGPAVSLKAHVPKKVVEDVAAAIAADAAGGMRF